MGTTELFGGIRWLRGRVRPRMPMGWWPVLVLDEPTEWLDPDTAAAVLADILGATCGRTTLLVTHERAGLEAADAIVTLRSGHEDHL